ncbi:MAG: histidine--tRNA ligase, partial [Myxococcales bacterium]
DLVRGCAPLVTDRVRIVADLKIARGLDYYTGSVFETRLLGHEGLGSICSGGRYDALASDGRTTYPGVGISLGLSRLLVPLLNRGELVASRTVPSSVLVSLADEDSRADSDEIATALRANGVPCEVAASPQKFGKQIRNAERRGIPYVWFRTDEGHAVKDIRSGEQIAADPQTWTPPEADLRPTITSTTPSTKETP